MAAQRLVRRLPVGESVVEAILALVRSARPGPEGGEAAKMISWGPSPRASQALMLAVRARALLDGRLAPSIDDVLDLAEPVLKHRMALTFTARAEGESIEAVDRPPEVADRIADGGRAQAHLPGQRGGWTSGRRRPDIGRQHAAAHPGSAAGGSHRQSTACTAAAAPDPARISGNTAASCPASRRHGSIGGARRATIISMCASWNGRPRTRCGSGPTARRR